MLTGEPYTEPLLPSNYLLYANCVSTLLDKVIDHYDKCTPKPTIELYTFFNNSIERWYNISYASKPVFWASKDWWYNGKNGYLDKMKYLARHRYFTIKRLVGVDSLQHGSDIVDPRKIIIKLKKDDDPEFVSVKDLLKRLDSQKYEKVDLLASILPKHPDAIVGDPFVIPIGTIKNGYHLPESWDYAIRYFQNNFHSFPSANLDESGVYYKYCKKEEFESGKHYLSKDDFFIITVRYGNEIGKPFGIVFNQDEKTDTSGIKILNRLQIDRAIAEFCSVWDDNTLSKKSIDSFLE